MKVNVYIWGIFLCLFLLMSSILVAQTASIATADDFTAAELNPAALGFGNASGLAFAGFFDKDGIEDRYRLYFNRESLAFVYGKAGSSNNYRLATSVSLFRNFYLGGDMNWLNSEISAADYSVSSLFRPHNMISLGMNVKEVNRSNPGYHFGLGLRPFTGLSYWSDRITLTGDISYARKRSAGAKENTWDKPVFGLETEFIDGMKISGIYDVETETAGINLSLAFGRTRIGSRVNFDEDNDYQGGSYYLFAASKDHRSLPLPRRRNNIYNYKMRDPIVDEREQRKIGLFVIMSRQTTMKRHIETIRTLKEDDSIRGIVFKNPQLKTSFANAMELREELLQFKAAGKKIAVYGDDFGNLHYAFFASIADEMYLNPNGMVGLSGFSIAIPYVNETLDKLGIDVYDLRSHDYKTSLNIFTESEMTDEEEETYRDLIEDYYLHLSAMIEDGRRGKLAGDLDEIINNGPYLLAQNALGAGLIDKILYEDQVEDEIKNLLSEANVIDDIPHEKMTMQWSEPRETKIALIYATGSIVMGDGVPGRSIGSKTTARQIKRAREDSSVKGIILRINSGGGSAYASDLIAREVLKCREAGKPVVVSMGGAAASGGYYIAAYADRIIANPTTITGSIGVTGLIPNFNRMFDKLAIRWSSVKKGENADLLAFYRPIEQEEIMILDDYILERYDQFINVVAQGRRMSYEEVHQVAQGRVWTGQRAKELGLVDTLGGMDEAVESIKEIGGFDKIRLEDYSYQHKGLTFGIRLGGMFIAKADFLKLPEELEALMRFREIHEIWNGERALYLMPVFEIEGID